jgi:hypothetical protein
LIRYKKKIWVGANLAIQPKIIAAFHSSALGGHFGVQATFQRVSKLFWWQGIKQDVESFIKQCSICQQAKHENCKLLRSLSPLPILENFWQDLSIDFINGLPKCEGYSVILVVVDRRSKYAHFLPLKHPYTAHSVAKIFFTNVVKLHGVPRTIVCDRDKIFTSSFWKELFRLLNTQLCMSSAYHEQSDDHTERINQCLEAYLRCATCSTPRQWLKWLPLAELWYNSTFHTSLKCSTFKALYRIEPSMGMVPSTSDSDHVPVQHIFHEGRQFLDLLKHNMTKVQNRMKDNDDKKQVIESFRWGSWSCLNYNHLLSHL